MKILLWEFIDKLGAIGDVVTVKPGYARNYLFPKGWATLDSPSQRKALQVSKRKKEQQEVKRASDARSRAEAIEKISISLEVNTTEDGSLYGSVTPTMIADALREKGAVVEPKAIEIDEPIKQVGLYEVSINLHREVKPKLKVWVVSVNPASAPAAEAKPASGEAPAAK